MPRALTLEEDTLVKKKWQDKLPEYLNVNFEPPVPISREFEAYLILLPSDVTNQLKTILNNIIEDQTDKQARGDLATAFLTNSKNALTARAKVYKTDIDKVLTTINQGLVGKTKLGTDLSGLSDVPEAGYMFEDAKFTQAETSHHYAAANFLALSLDTTQEQWKNNFLPEARKKQMQSWINLFSLYS